MRKVLSISFFFLIAAATSAQTPVGTWSDHLSYTSARCLAVSSGKVFVSNGEALVVYDRQYDELKKLNRTNGLTDSGIDAIGWSEENKALVIGYSNTNLDILLNNSVYNINAILNKYIPGRKVINRIRTGGRYAYLACSFGIVVIDIPKKEVYDTWNPASGTDRNEVFDLSFSGDRIYAATETGVFYAGLKDQGLSYPGNWTRVNSFPDPSGKYSSIATINGSIFVNKADPDAAGDSLFITGSSTYFLDYLPGTFNISMDQGPEGVTVASGSLIRYFGPSGALKRTIAGYGFASPAAQQGVADNQDLWIADLNSGLVRVKNMTDFLLLNLPGPSSLSAFFITSVNGETVICGGGTDESWNSLNRPYEVSDYKEGRWNNFTYPLTTDAVRALIDPDNPGHFFISTWGNGLFEYSNNTLLHQYNAGNSPLQSAFPGEQTVKVCGLAMDKNRNLWITQSGVSGNIKILKADGNWTDYSVNVDAPVAGDIIVTRSGYKWIILPGGYGIYVLDDNGTPAAGGDDRHIRLTVRDQENQVIYNVYSIAEDADGNIWIGTDQGPLVYYDPAGVFDDELRAERIKVPRNDGSGLSDYLLKTEIITAVAVDGSNRKWLATAGSGAFYVSPDGTSQLKTFNTRNSPILSDSITALSVDNKTGEIWIGTTKGIQSYRGLATEGSAKFSRVYAFPNPVREDFSGSVTITGLIRDTRVKITDISGNLVFETISEGGQAAWDLRTYNGKQVSTGVYLVFCANNEGSQAVVTKLLVVRK